MTQPTITSLDDVATWRDLLEWAWTTLQGASPWLSPLLWAVILIALVVLWVKGRGWDKVKAVLKWVQKAVSGVDQLITLVDDMAYVKGQLQNNGGSTVKDEVQKLAVTVGRVEKKVDGAKRTSAEARSTAARTEKMLIDHISRQDS